MSEPSQPGVPAEDNISSNLEALRLCLANLAAGKRAVHVAPSEEQFRDPLSQAMDASEIMSIPDLKKRLADRLETRGRLGHYSLTERIDIPEISGGTWFHNFVQQGTDDDYMPEACRFANSALHMACSEAGIKSEYKGDGKEKVLVKGTQRTRRGMGPDGEPTGKNTDRHLRIVIPDEDAEAFNSSLKRVIRAIDSSPQLVSQYRQAMDLSLKPLSKLPCVKTFIELGGSSRVKGDMQLTLSLENVPMDLARQVAEATGVNFNAFPNSTETHSRDMQTTYPGMGKNIKLNLGSRAFDEAAKVITEYAAHAQDSMHQTLMPPSESRPAEPQAEQAPAGRQGFWAWMRGGGNQNQRGG